LVGGDGTHRGAEILAKTALAMKLKVSVIGIPKTIDNDIDLIDKVTYLMVWLCVRMNEKWLNGKKDFIPLLSFP
jgi:Phosphofructokinase